jgi:hypothetical protein
MKRNLIALFIAFVAISVVAGPVPQQRTRIINQVAGTNQLLSTWTISSFVYTNETIDVVAVGHYGHAPFLRVGDDVRIAGFGNTGTNGIDGWYQVSSFYGQHVLLYRGTYGTTNTGSTGIGYLTFDQPFTSISIVGQKAPSTNNAGDVQIGLGTNAVGPLTLATGGLLSIKAEVGDLSLTNWSVNAANNLDGVVVIYFPK